MEPDPNSIIKTLLEKIANLSLEAAQYKSLAEQYQKAAEKAEEK